MATDKPRFTITMDPSLLDRVDAFRRDQHINTQSRAIQELVRIGVETLRSSGTLPETKKAPDISSEARQIAQLYDALDDHGRRVVRAVMDEETVRMTAPAEDGADTKIIPLFGTAAAAGPGEPDTGNPFEEYSVPADSPADFAVRITGDSMEPYLHDGEIALCKKRRAKIGEVAVMSINGSLLVKQYIEDGFNIFLRSTNRLRKDCDYDIWATGNETVQGWGTVIMQKIPLVDQ